MRSIIERIASAVKKLVKLSLSAWEKAGISYADDPKVTSKEGKYLFIYAHSNQNKKKC